MKHTYWFLIANLLLLSSASFAQSVPFLSNDVVNTSHFYYPNEGQIADESGTLHPEVLYHSELTQPENYFQKNTVSFVSMAIDTLTPDTLHPDTIYRIDMEFYNKDKEISENTTLTAYDERDVKLNYYLPHCSNGVEGVPGYERLIYKEAYSKIDVEFTSNVSGMKGRFIVQPGGDPNDIILRFTGQDAIVQQIGGELTMYLDAWEMDFPQAYAYQVDANGQPYLLNWLPNWVHNGAGDVTVSTGTFNASEPLILELGGAGTLSGSTSGSVVDPYWSTYYGGIGQDLNTAMTTDDNEYLYTASNIKTAINTFPPQSGAILPNETTFNWLVSRFDANDDRKYATYFGGNGNDRSTAIDVADGDAITPYLHVAGYTESTDLGENNLNATFNQGKQSGVDGLIATFRKGDGGMEWNSYFGGNGNDYITDMVLNRVTNEMYFCGYTSSTDQGNSTGSVNGFPLVNYSGSFYQNVNQGETDAFVAQYNTDTKVLDWSTYYGGDAIDRAYGIDFSSDNNNVATLYVAGETYTASVASSLTSPVTSNSNGYFPLADPGNGAYVQSQFGSTASSSVADGFLAQFNASKALTWASFFGGNGKDGFKDVAINDQGVFVVGVTESTTATSGNCTTNTQGLLPNCVTTTNGYTDAYNDYGDLVLTHFSSSGALLWATCYGDNGEEAAYGNVSAATDDLGNVYIVSNSSPLNPILGTSTGMDVQNYAGQYFQGQNTHIAEGGYGADNVLLMFNDQYERLWVTYFGGGCNGCIDHTGDEIAMGIATYAHDWVYFSGQDYGSETPIHQPNNVAYFDPSFNGGGYDGYITKLDVVNVATFLEELTENGTLEYLKAYPNPATDHIMLEIPEAKNEQVTIILYNRLGQKVRTNTATTLQQQLTLEVADLPVGVYFVALETNSSHYVCSFVKQ